MLQITQIPLGNPFYWLKGGAEGQLKCTLSSWVTKALILKYSNLKEEKLFRPRTMTWQRLTLALSHNALLPDHRHSISFSIKSTQTIIIQHIWSRAEWKGNDYNLLRWLNSSDLSAIKVSEEKSSERMSNDSLFFRWEGRRVQSTLLHLDGDVE